MRLNTESNQTQRSGDRETNSDLPNNSEAGTASQLKLEGKSPMAESPHPLPTGSLSHQE